MEDQTATIARLRAEVDRLRSRSARNDDDPTWADLVEDAILGVYRVAANGRFININRAFSRILGYDNPDHLMAEMRDINGLYVDPTVRSRILREVDRRGYLDGQEAEFRRRTGESVWIRFSTRRRLVGDEVQYEGFWVDITAEKEAREKLRRSEQRFRDMIELLPLGAAIFDRDRRCLYVNPQFVEMYGYTVEQVGDLDKWIRQVYPDDGYYRKIRRDLEAWLQGDRTEVRSGMEKITSETGRKRDVIFRAVSLNNGQILYLIEDVTDYLQAETEARINKSRIDLALEAGDMSMWDWDPITDELFFSSRFYDLLGRRLNGRPRPFCLNDWFDIVHPDDLEGFSDALEKHLSGETRRFEHEFRFRTDSGQWRWMLGRGKVIDLTLDGRPSRVMGVLTDITSRRQAEKDLREANRAREEADRRTLALIRSSAANVAHQVGGFLNKLVFALAIVRAERLCPESIETLDAVERGGIALDAFVRRFIALTKPPKPDYRPIDLNDVINQALSDCAGSLESAQVEIEAVSAGPTRLLADKGILTAVLRNLIMAAVDALIKQAVARRLRLFVGPGEEAGVRLELTSAGPGPDKAVGPSRTGREDQIDAVGLELPAAQYLIAVHGGEVNFRPQPGQPIRFVLDLSLDPKRK